MLAKHPANLVMDNISVGVVFGLPGQMGATGLANLEIPCAVGVRSTPLRVESGSGGYGGLVVPELPTFAPRRLRCLA